MTAKKSSAKKMLKIQQVRSGIGFPRTQREVLKSLGLRRIRHTVERQDTPAVRGAVAKIQHLVRIIPDGADRRGQD
jgi:large subunit ribosomal protein L30